MNVNNIIRLPGQFQFFYFYIGCGDVLILNLSVQKYFSNKSQDFSLRQIWEVEFLG